MTRRQRRLTMIGGALLVLGIAVALVLNALRDSIVFFSTPVMVAVTSRIKILGRMDLAEKRRAQARWKPGWLPCWSG